jgi:hypothetical protein
LWTEFTQQPAVILMKNEYGALCFMKFLE